MCCRSWLILDAERRNLTRDMKLLLCSRIEDLDVLKGMLAEAGIACEVTNDTVPLPGAEFYPKLWVVEDAEFPRAAALLEAFRKLPAPSLRLWTCPSCGEQLEEQFSSCWKCGTPRNDVA
jgi:hypothetical protein